MIGNWKQEWSKTHKAYYWFDSTTGKRSWTAPEAVVHDSKQESPHSTGKRILQETLADINVPATKKREIIIHPNVAIIVPFRDIHAEQSRAKHLQQFIANLPTLLTSVQQPHANFNIIIVEQSRDDRKFNRGKLLNIGFEIARKEFHSNIFIFHDVDLLPSKDLAEEYFRIPTDNPIHIARVWSRYNKNPKYFGGIVSFSEEMFVRINGFPNNFWGWGGEDDEMYKRIEEVSLNFHVLTNDIF